MIVCKILNTLWHMIQDFFYVRLRMAFLTRRYYRCVQIQFIQWFLQQQAKHTDNITEFATYLYMSETKAYDLISNTTYLSLKDMVRIAFLLGYKIVLRFEPLSEWEMQEIEELRAKLDGKFNS